MNINLRFDEIKVDLSNDGYGKQFWVNIENRFYEPDTIGFIENNLSIDTIFLDIGAANGAVTLIASSLGSSVIAYEPSPEVYNVLKRNVELNSHLKGYVEPRPVAVSSRSGTLNFSSGQDSSILSSIVFTGIEKTNMTEIEVVSLQDELDNIVHLKKKIFIKMDIEGAEWKILHDKNSLISLKNHKAKMLVALHPGFHRPYRKHWMFLNRIAIEIWRLNNFIESIKIFNKLINYCSISRTNLNPVKKPLTFALLVLAGYHEFILDFSSVQ